MDHHQVPLVGHGSHLFGPRPNAHIVSAPRVGRSLRAHVCVSDWRIGPVVRAGWLSMRVLLLSLE